MIFNLDICRSSIVLEEGSVIHINVTGVSQDFIIVNIVVHVQRADIGASTPDFFISIPRKVFVCFLLLFISLLFAAGSSSMPPRDSIVVSEQLDITQEPLKESPDIPMNDDPQIRRSWRERSRQVAKLASRKYNNDLIVQSRLFILKRNWYECNVRIDDKSTH